MRRVTFSDGVVVPPVDVSWEENRERFYQRRLRNKRKFSQNWKKVVRKITKLESRIANIRKDETQKFTTEYSRSWDSATKQEPTEGIVCESVWNQ